MILCPVCGTAPDRGPMPHTGSYVCHCRALRVNPWATPGPVWTFCHSVRFDGALYRVMPYGHPRQLLHPDPDALAHIIRAEVEERDARTVRRVLRS